VIHRRCGNGLLLRYTPTLCTVVVAVDGTRCGRPAAATFRARGVVFAECARHREILYNEIFYNDVVHTDDVR
jgi:hypothetical protein